MLQAYHSFKELYLHQGYEAALAYLDAYPAPSPPHELLKTNFYIYLLLQRNFQPSRTLTLLQSCLAHPACTRSLLALTRYHICQTHFLTDQTACGRECEELVRDCIGSYHMLKERTERTEEEEEEMHMLEYILYYCLLLMAWLSGQQSKQEQAQGYLRASRNLLKANNKSSQLINASLCRTRSTLPH